MYIRVKSNSPDRVVHAYNDKFEVVRYGKTRHWFIEPKDLRHPRERITLEAAISFTAWLLRNRDVVICRDIKGGEKFEAELAVIERTLSPLVRA